MLKNKLSLITGATSGIGLSTAEKLASSGSNLIITGRRSEKLAGIADKFQSKYGVKILPLTMDVRSREEVVDTLGSLPQEFKDIDILVNNAGLAAGADLVHEASLDDWDQMIDTNLKGLMYVTKVVLPGMIERNTGHLVNIASTAGHVVYPGGSVYCATKHAVKAVTKTLMLELMDHDIRVSSIDPGKVMTEFSEVRFKGDKEKIENEYKGFTPLSPEDVADAVHYVVTRPAHMMVGELVLYATAQGDGRSVSRKGV
jgi:3-hydroxy acid dehydrogenase/malonic semialdehyde reductase